MNLCRALLALALAAVPGFLDPVGAEEPEGQLRAYDVGAIVGGVQHAPFILRPKWPLIYQPDSSPAAADLPTFGGEESKPQAARADPRTYPLVSAETLLERLRDHLIERGLWKEDQALQGMRISEDVLFARGGEEVHQAILEFLKPLEAKAVASVQVECLLAPPEVLEMVAPAWRLEGPYLKEEVFERALLNPRSRLLSVVARNGQKAAAGSREIQAFLSDLEVDQRGVIPVTNPVIEAPTAGNRLEVYPLLVPGEESVWLELSVGQIQVEAETVNIGPHYGDLELPRSNEVLISTSTLAVPGTALVAGSLEDQAHTVALVRVKKLGSHEHPPVAAGEEGMISREYDVSFLNRPVLRRWPLAREGSSLSISAGRGYSFESRIPLLLGEEFAERVVEAGGAFNLEYQLAGHFSLRAGASTHRKVERFLGDEMKRLTRVGALDLRLVEVPRAVLAEIRARTEDGLLLASGWEAGLEGKEGVKQSRFTLAALSGEVHALRGARLVSFVSDSEQVSGGTGFTITERSDPIISACGEGADLRIRVDLLPDGARARVQLEGARAALHRRQVTARFPVLETKVASEGSIQRVEELQLTLPHQAVQYWDVDRTVPLGREVILHTDASKGEEAQVLIGRIRSAR